MKYGLIICSLFVSLSLQSYNEDFDQTAIGQCVNYALATSYVEENSFIIILVNDDALAIKSQLSPFFIWKNRNSDRVEITYRSDLSEGDYLKGALIIDHLVKRGSLKFSCLYSI